MGRPEKQFDEKVLLTIAETSGDRGKGTVLGVSAWTVDGRTGQPQLSKREKWQTEDGSWRKGAAKGLTATDLMLILQNLPRVAEAMGFPLARFLSAIPAGSNGTSPATAKAPAKAAAEPF